MKIVAAWACACATFGSAQAHDFCVATAADLQGALNQSGDGGLYANELDSINIVQGSYFTSIVGAPFHYSSTAQHDVYIRGGWGPGCGGNVANTSILDGTGTTSRVLETHSTLGAVYLTQLTIQHGSVAGSIGGLSMNANAGENGYVQMVECVIQDNSAGGGFAGFLLGTGNHGAIFLENNLVVDNTSAAGAVGGVYADATSEIDVYNNTIAQNTSTDSSSAAGLQYVGSGPGYFRNNIFWNNTLNGLVLNRPTAVLIDNDYGSLGGSDPPAAGSSGNVLVSPHFVDAANGNFRLSAASPLFAAGHALPAAAFRDLDGEPLAASGRIDLGAYQDTVFSDGHEAN